MKNKFEFFLLETVLIMLVFSASYVLATLPPFEPKTRKRGEHVAVISTPEKEQPSKQIITVYNPSSTTAWITVTEGNFTETIPIHANSTSVIIRKGNRTELFFLSGNHTGEALSNFHFGLGWFGTNVPNFVPDSETILSFKPWLWKYFNITSPYWIDSPIHTENDP